MKIRLILRESNSSDDEIEKLTILANDGDEEAKERLERLVNRKKGRDIYRSYPGFDLHRLKEELSDVSKWIKEALTDLRVTYVGLKRGLEYNKINNRDNWLVERMLKNIKKLFQIYQPLLLNVGQIEQCSNHHKVLAELIQFLYLQHLFSMFL